MQYHSTRPFASLSHFEFFRLTFLVESLMHFLFSYTLTGLLSIFVTISRKPLIGKKKQKKPSKSRLKVNNKLGATGWVFLYGGWVQKF